MRQFIKGKTDLLEVVRYDIIKKEMQTTKNSIKWPEKLKKNEKDIPISICTKECKPHYARTVI